jgi:hypothetical protein
MYFEYREFVRIVQEDPTNQMSIDQESEYIQYIVQKNEPVTYDDRQIIYQFGRRFNWEQFTYYFTQ